MANRTLIALFILTAWAAPTVIGQTTTEGVSSYDIAVVLFPETNTLVGTQRIEYVNDTGETLSEVIFCLLGNLGAEENPYIDPALLDAQYTAGFDPTWTRIGSVADGAGNPLAFRLEPAPAALQTYSLDDGLLVVGLPEALAPGEQVTLQIPFETKFADGMLGDNCVYRDTYIWRFGWNPIAVSAAARSGQFALPAAQYHVELSLPIEYTALGGADRQTRLEASEGFATIVFDNDRPTRSVPLIIGKDLGVVSAKWNQVEMQAAFLPGGETFARLALSYAAEILDYHEAHYGPLGYRRLVIAENPMPGFFGMAADGMILAGSLFPRMKDMPALGTYDRLTEYLLAHELAHLWWGIGIGVDFNAENWISEGFAEYLSISYFEDKYGAFEPNLFAHLGDGLLEDVLRELVGFFNLRQHLAEAPYLDLLKLGFDEALVQPLAEVEYLNGQTVRTYNKGYLVLRALEGAIGRERMEEILQTARSEWLGRTLTVNELRALVERVSGSDLYPGFFTDWVTGAAQLDIAVEGFDSRKTETGYTTTIHVRRSGPDLPVVIEATLSDGSKVRTTFVPDCCSAVAPPFETEFPVVSVHLDPEEMLPDGNRFNNHSPRKILTDHPFRGEDAPPIGKPLDAYLLTLSPAGLSGAFRNDHQWSVMAIPHIDPSAAPEEVDFARMLEVWDVIGLFAANVDRNLSILAQGTLTGLDLTTGDALLDAQITASTRFFTHPETGTAGRYWYPTHQLDLSIGSLGELPQPTGYLALALNRSELPASVMSNTVTLTLGIPGFGTAPFALIDWSAALRLRLAPMLYLDAWTSASGALLGPLPSPFSFRLSQLHAFGEPLHGDRQLYARIEVVLPPLARDTGYAILNLTRVDTVTASLFVHGGRTWALDRFLSDAETRVEAGGKMTIRVFGFLGMPMEISLGYAQPLVGPMTGGVPFIEFGGL